MPRSTRRTFLKRAGITALGATVLGGGTYFYSEHIEPAWIDITSTTLHLPRLQPAFAGYRIVQLTDIHSDQVWMDKERLATIVALANEQKPDLIVITGDFVTSVRSYTKDILSALQGLQARDGVFGVLGNHDYWNDPDLVRQYIAQFGVKELNNQLTTLHRGDSSLHLVGMDDLLTNRHKHARSPWVYQDRLTTLVKQLPEQGAAILLIHEPDFADVAAASKRIDLQLSGHTHGGQVRMPLIGAIRVPTFGKKYVAGLYQVGSMQHYTSRGLGMSPPLVRFDCRPELATFTLQ